MKRFFTQPVKWLIRFWVFGIVVAVVAGCFGPSEEEIAAQRAAERKEAQESFNRVFGVKPGSKGFSSENIWDSPNKKPGDKPADK